MIPAHYLVIDIEATCCDQNSIPKHQFETIEIGAVMVNATALETVGEHQTFIRPVIRPKLTAFCTKLTSIGQNDVETAPLFADAIATLRRWAFSFDEFLFCSWGDYDRTQLGHECERNHVSYPFSRGHLNLKLAFREQQKLPRKLGMEEALRVAGVDLVGVHHRGIDDARNIARLLPWALGRKNIA